MPSWSGFVQIFLMSHNTEHHMYWFIMESKFKYMLLSSTDTN